MAEPAGYRDHGPGDDTRRHSSHKRTRGDDEHDVKYARRRYDGDDEKSISDERTRDSDYDHGPQNKRQEQQSNPATGSKSRSDHRSLARSPSPSPTRHHHSHHHHHHHRRHRPSAPPANTTPDELPFGSRRLLRSDLENFRSLLAQYLEIQKQKDMAALDEREVKGRWKSFVGKWNRGELAEGWYHPETLADARRNGLGAVAAVAATAAVGEQGDASSALRLLPPTLPHSRREREVSDGGSSSAMRLKEDEEEDDEDNENEDEDDDGYGPTLPPGDTSDASRSARRGPAIPNLQDLALRREAVDEERMSGVDQLRLARKADRAEQRERLEDLAPRADAGTRERRLEKRREVNDKMRGFRERSPGNVGEVGEAELMGGGGGGAGGGGDEIVEYKRVQEAARRRRSEREVRREEEARAKAAEREVRMEEYRRREESTMKVLRQIARERFG
ncbi:hypothetical protein F4820DRAFT_461960 [Hypoxylon rubiginosum]|uniref:Uncharacterized protein n=1 Tax=Hypoxylon rubiginosum TaxID=110542 RepID=A0ACB9YL46_9PEZI|nr:hypothetical protein F4820DRAFT_461960 [Hypoxylon rubiginosum]